MIDEEPCKIDQHISTRKPACIKVDEQEELLLLAVFKRD